MFCSLLAILIIVQFCIDWLLRHEFVILQTDWLPTATLAVFHLSLRVVIMQMRMHLIKEKIFAKARNQTELEHKGVKVAKRKKWKRKREKEREKGASCSLVRGYLYSNLFPIIGGTNENSRQHQRKRGTGENFVRDRDSSLDISHVLSQFAVPRLFIPFSRLSRPVARLLRSITRFSLPLPRSYLPIHVETTSPTNILRKNVHEDARTVVTCEASRPTSTPEGLSCCLIAFRMVTLSIWQCQIQQACISFILFFFKGATIGHLKFLLCFILLFSTTKLYNSNVL